MVGEVKVKPRQVEAWTKEDFIIWGHVCYRFQPKIDSDYCPETWSVLADRCAADLMLGIERCRQYEHEHPEEFVEYAGWGWVHAMLDAALDGYPVKFAGLDITYFA
jgi:hypothetical protein